MNETKTRGLGWIPDLPDFRDYTEDSPHVRAILGPTGLTPVAPGRKRRAALPKTATPLPSISPPTTEAKFCSFSSVP